MMHGRRPKHSARLHAQARILKLDHYLTFGSLDDRCSRPARVAQASGLLQVKAMRVWLTRALADCIDGINLAGPEGTRRNGALHT